MLDTPLMLVELSVMEQRYQAVSFVIHDGESVVEVARRFNVSRQSVHAWLARYERGGLAALADRSRRPKSSPDDERGVLIDLGQQIIQGPSGKGAISLVAAVPGGDGQVPGLPGRDVGQPGDRFRDPLGRVLVVPWRVEFDDGGVAAIDLERYAVVL